MEQDRLVNEQQWSRFLSRWDCEVEVLECNDSRFERASAFQHPPLSDTRTTLGRRATADGEILAQQFRQQRRPPKSSYTYGYSDRCYPPAAEDRLDTIQRPPSQRVSYLSENTAWAKSPSSYVTAATDFHSQGTRTQDVGGFRRFDDQRAHKLDIRQRAGPRAVEPQLSYRHPGDRHETFLPARSAAEFRQRYGRLAGQESFRSDHPTPEPLPHDSSRHAPGPSTSATLPQSLFSTKHSREQTPCNGQPPLKVQKTPVNGAREQEFGMGTRQKSYYSQGSNSALDDNAGLGRQGPGARNPATPANVRAALERSMFSMGSPEGKTEAARDTEPGKRQGVSRPAPASTTAKVPSDEKDQEDNSKPSSKSSGERCISPLHNEMVSNQRNHSASNSGSNEPQDQEEVNLNTVARQRTQASLVIGSDPLVRSKRAGKRALLALAALEDEIVNPGPRDRMTEEDTRMHVKKSINLAVAAGKFAFIKMQEMLSRGSSGQGDAPSTAGNSVEGNNDDD